MANKNNSYVDLNVRELFETNTIESVREVHKKVNHEIERKKEELRMLVGESYRDLIDAADTIGVMKTSSSSVSDKLKALRVNLKTMPTHLGTGKAIITLRENKFTPTELEIAAELKLTLEAQRNVRFYLEQSKVVDALHLYLLSSQKLNLRSKPYKWTFLQGLNSIDDLDESMKSSILLHTENLIKDSTCSPKKLTECMIVQQVLTHESCESVVESYLRKQLRKCESILSEGGDEFIDVIAKSINSLHTIFIEPQLYSNVARQVRKPKISMDDLGIRFTPKSVETFQRESILVDEPPRVSKLAEILMQSFISALKEMLEKSYDAQIYLSEVHTLEDMEKYRQATVQVLKVHCEDLMRIVLGTTKTLWSEVFLDVFHRKCKAVISKCVSGIITHLREYAFPQLQKLDAEFDLISFIWTPVAIGDKVSTLEDDLKLKCVSPHVAEINLELENRCESLLTDSRHLNDNLIKEFISQIFMENLESFVNEIQNTSSGLFLGRWCSTMGAFCPTLWKLLKQNDALKLKNTLGSISEHCCSAWSFTVLDKFQLDLDAKLSDLSIGNITRIMPVAEEYVGEGEGALKPSIRVPLQISHVLQSLLFATCLEFARIGPQSIPKSVRDSFRLSVGQKLATFYDQLTLTDLTPQTALQLIFDLKFVKWFHPSLSSVVEPSTLKLEGLIDPFDLNIVNSKINVNLKRCLFENHLTLGLLFSEESHGFVAQNFKTKGNQTFPLSNTVLNVPLPVLPI